MTSATVATRNLVGRTVAERRARLTILRTLDHCLGSNRTHARQRLNW